MDQPSVQWYALYLDRRHILSSISFFVSKAANADTIAKKRAEIAAKAAAMLKKNPALQAATAMRPGPSVAAPVPRVPVVPASLPSKVVYAGTPSPSVSSGPTPATPATPASGPGTPAAGISDDLVRRVAEAKRRVADAQSKLAVKDNPYMVWFSSHLC